MRMRALHPDPARGPGLQATDVDVDAGVAVDALRPLLARLTGWAGWAGGGGRVVVGDRVLTGDHPAGVAPLLPGAVLRATPSLDGPDPLLVAAHEAHVAVVGGPDAGHVLPLRRGATVVVGRRGADAARGAGVPAARPGRADRAASHTVIGRRSVSQLLALDDDALPVLEVARRGRVVLARVDGGRPRVWRGDRPLLAGRTTFVVRRPDRGRPRRLHGRVPRGPGSSTAWDAGARDVPAPAPERLGRAPGRRTWVVWLVPLAGSVALGLATHQPWLALTGLLMPLSSVLTTQRGAERGSLRRRDADPPPDLPALAVATALAAVRPASVEGPAAGGGQASRRRAPASRALPRLARGTADAAPGDAAPGKSHRATAAPEPPAPVAAPRATAVPPPPHVDATSLPAGAPRPRTPDDVPRAAAGEPPPPVRVEAPWDPAGTVAVVGPREPGRAVARAIALGALGSDGASALVIRTDDPAAWSWAAWLTEHDAALPGPSHGPALVVADEPLTAAIAAWRAAAPPHQRLVLLARRRDLVPSWCASVLHVDEPAATRPQGVARAAGVSHAWADAQARRLAAVRHHAARRPTPSPPPVVALGDLPDVPPATAAAVTRSWSAGLRPVPLGVGAGGRVVTVDLRRDGPHALVAGTTGAGKSALLSTLVLAHALGEPPDRLAVLLVDFKGGAGLGPVAGLPHVLDHVTDLDAVRARRVLVGLAAELRRRELLLARGGATDLTGLDADRPETPPRLLVVVDELRALADDVPDAMPSLARLAAQGRALGVHLVLATQRPAGAVPADLRANLGLRICLRVADAADSTDVLDDPAAARIDPALPGRALLRVAGGPLVPFQTARAATAAPARVRRAPPWPAAATWTPRRPSPEPPAAPWVGAMRAAAVERPARSTPWLPELPPRVRADDVPDGVGLPVALADLASGRAATGTPRRGGAPTVSRPWSPPRPGRRRSGGAARAGVPRPHRARGRRARRARRRDRRAAGRSVRSRPSPARAAAPRPDDAAALAGVPRDLATGPRGPGRAVHLHDGPPALCQLALPEPLPRDASARPALSGDAPARVLPLPARVHRPEPAGGRQGLAPAHPHVAIGVGGDTAAEVALDLEVPRLVVGPPGSGRTTALDAIAAGASRAGVVVVRLAPALAGLAPADDAPEHDAYGVRTSSADGAAAVLAARPDALLLVDDLDELERTDDSVAALVASRRRRLAVATTAQVAAIGGHRGSIASLLRARRLLVLAPHDGASAELIGPRAAWLADPRGCPPGRGALVDGRTVVPLQVYG